MVAVRTPARRRRGIIAARLCRRLKRCSNSAKQRGTCLALTARQVPVIAALTLPSAVLTHLKAGRQAGTRAAAGPDPALTAGWPHPASATPAKHCSPSLTTVQTRRNA